MVLRPSEPDPSTSGVYARHSAGLEQFFSYIRDERGLALLDLGGLNQATASFVTSLGHRLYSEDLLRNLWQHVSGSSSSEPISQTQIDVFLEQNLDYPDNMFHGVLVWDALEHLEHPLRVAAVERLRRIVRPGSYLLAVFHSQERFEEPVQHSFRIQDSKTLLLTPRTRNRPLQVFNNRSLERIFQGFESLKFFLTRDNLREVIVKR